MQAIDSAARQMCKIEKSRVAEIGRLCDQARCSLHISTALLATASPGVRRSSRPDQARHSPANIASWNKRRPKFANVFQLLPLLPGRGVKRILQHGDPLSGLAQTPAQLAGDVLQEEDVGLRVALVELVEVEIRQLVEKRILLRAAGERARPHLDQRGDAEEC